MQNPAAVDDFVAQVTELAKQVLLESKSLAEVVTAEDAEERFPEHARQAATATSRLIEVVNAANIDFFSQQEELLQATREARDCLLELCRATKAAISNPYDFLTTQKLQNCRKGIALAIKQVLEISELIKEPQGDTVEKTIEEARSAVQAIGKMVVAARSQNSETFIETAKGAAASMSKMIEVAKQRNLDHEALFNSTQSIIKAAKATYKDNNKANQEELEASMKLIAEDIKQFVSALQNAPAPTPISKTFTPLPPVALDQSVAPRALPPPSNLPPPSSTLSRNSGTPNPSIASAPLPPKALPPPPSLSVTPASPTPAPPTAIVSAPAAASNAKQSEVAHAHVFAFLQRFIEDSKAFRDEWNVQGLASQEAFVRRLDQVPIDQMNINIREKLQALKNIAGALKPVSKEDQLAQSELENIRNLKDFAEWKKSTMGYSLRKKFASTVDALSKAGATEIAALPKDSIVPQVMDSAAALAECVLDFIIKSFIILPDDQGSSSDFEAVTRELHDRLRRIVLISKASLGANYTSLEKLLTTVVNAIDANPNRGQADEGVRAVATTLLAQLVTATTKKRLFREANAVRVLTIHMLCTINAASTNKSSLHYIFACQLGMIAKALTESLSRLLNTHETLRFLAANRKTTLLHDVSDVDLANEDTKGGKKGKINAQFTSLLETEKSIWDESEVPAKELQKGILTGSLNKLVLCISAESAYDNKMLKTFITTYRSFCAPYKLFQKLMERYNVPQGRGVDQKKIQTRVTIILKYWVENQFFDFDESLVGNLHDFVDNTLPKDGWGDIANILKKQLKAQLEARNESMGSVPPTDFTMPESKMSPTELFMALNDEEIARQLTLIEFSIYKQIEPSELLNQSWNKDKLKYRAPNVIESLSRLNRLSFWVPSVILWQERMKERSKAYKKFVAIAEHLRRMNNYHTLMGIVAGLNMSSINRLKHTLNDVGLPVQNQFKELVKLMHPQGSFKSYRQALHKSKAPAIPYLGTYLTDLTFIEDGNPDNIDGQINFKKREMIHGTVQEIQLYQTTPYPFPPVEPIYTFLTDLPYCGEKDLFDVSLILEPRDSELNQIIQ